MKRPLRAVWHRHYGTVVSGICFGRFSEVNCHLGAGLLPNRGNPVAVAVFQAGGAGA